MTDLLLALIACLLAIIALRVARGDTPTVNFYEDEEGNRDLARAILQLQLHARQGAEIQVTKLPDDIHKVAARVQSTAVDVQGLIDLLARYLVLNMPEAAYKDLGPPSEWLKKEDVDSSENPD